MTNQIKIGELYRTELFGYLFEEEPNRRRHTDKKYFDKNVIFCLIDKTKLIHSTYFKLLLPTTGQILYTPTGKEHLFLKHFKLVEL
jgi:hypothetical protein